MKTEDIRNMAESEILSTISEHETLLSNLRFSHSISPIENPARMRRIRKDIARLKTILHARSLGSNAN